MLRDFVNIRTEFSCQDRQEKPSDSAESISFQFLRPKYTYYPSIYTFLILATWFMSPIHVTLFTENGVIANEYRDD